MKVSRAILSMVFCILLAVFLLPMETQAAGAWTSIGPWGGNIRGIAVDAGDSNTLYAITYGCGFFNSTDGGATWNQSGLSGGSWTLQDASLTALAADPVNPGVVYAGTSEGKVYKSVNGGANWSSFYSGLPTPFGQTKSIMAIVVDPINPSTIYAGTEENGVYKSTGGSWSAVTTGLINFHITALAIDPALSNTIYAGTDNGGAFKSTDYGNNWSALSGEPDAIRSLAVDLTNTSIIYAGYTGGVYNSIDGGTTWNVANTGIASATVGGLVVAPNATVFAATTWGFYKSTDAGGSWTAEGTGMESGAYLYEVTLAPGSSSTIYTAGASVPLYKSTDGAANWGEASDGLACWDMRAIAIDPNTSAIYAGDYGVGVLKTTDGGATWNKVNNGLIVTVKTLVVDPAISDTIYAGTYNGIFNSIDGGANWNAINSGLGSTKNTSVIAVDPFNSNHLLAVTDGGLNMSTNSGTSWSGIGGGISGTISSISFDPNTQDTIYVSTDSDGVFKSANGGGSWTGVNTGLTTSNIDTVAVSAADSNIVYAGARSGTAYRSGEGGANWALSSGGMDTYYLYDLLTHPTDADTAYAGTSEGIYKTTDGGGIWTTENVGLADHSIEDIEMDPANSNILYTVGLHSCVQKLEFAGDLRLPGSADFGDVEVDTGSTPQTITLENAGGATIAISNIQITGTGASQFSLDVNGGSNPCGNTPITITTGSSCTVDVTFSPTGGGTFTAALSVTSDDPQKTSASVALSGTGTYPVVPDIYLSPSSMPFGTVTEGTDSTPHTLYIYNYGNANLEISNILINGTDAAEFTLDPVGPTFACWNTSPTLSPWSYCTVKVTFSPADIGTKTASLHVYSNDPDTPDYVISLTGEGTAVPVPDIVLSLSSIDFGYAIHGTASLSEQVTIQNAGTGNLSISNVAVSGADSGEFDLDVNGGSSPCGSTSTVLWPSEECTVSLTFTPSSVAIMAASLDITSNDPDTSVTSVSLAGTGAPTPEPHLSVSLPTIDFGSLEGEQILTVTNEGSAFLNIGTVGSTDALEPPFSITADTCSGQTIAPDGNCTITVSFSTSVASASTVRSVGFAGLGFVFVGLVFMGNVRGRRKLAALILVLTLASGLLMSCGSSGGGGGGGGGSHTPATYTDSFDIPSDDPGTPSMTVNVLGRG